MKLPLIEGIIDRRILVNFQVDPGILSKFLPAPFRPKLYKGKALAGICLIRLKEIRPKRFPKLLGISSENAAHRIAVEWTEDGILKEGVYIPRRDTSSYFNHIAGGRIFPGKHHLAKFDVKEKGDDFHIAFKSSDGTSILFDGARTDTWSSSSVFDSIDDASSFFKKGAVGFSPNGHKLDGIELETFQWKVEPLSLNKVQSSFFDDQSIFPSGSVKFDNALLMTNLQHQWHSYRQMIRQKYT